MADDENIIEPAPFTRAETQQPKPGFRLRPVPAALGIVFLLLALAAAFMFGASAVRFNIQPQPETLRISSGFFSWRFGERFLMLPGTYRIRATLAGYEPLASDVKVSGQSSQVFSFKMHKLPGILTIATTPDVHAEVFVDQKLVGKTPITLASITVGVHDIRLKPQRYLTYDTEIDIKGQRIEQTINAPLKPAWSNIAIDSLPQGATVLVDNQEKGTTPTRIEILKGTHEIQLKKAAYKTWQSTIEVTAGNDQQLPKVVLIHADGKVNVTTEPAGANVTIGGRYRGQSPLEVALAPGKSYDVLFSKVGYAAEKRHITVQPGQGIVLDAHLNPVTGTVRLQVTPAGGELFVDGKSVGEPSRQLTLTSRKHHLKIVKAGYATWQTSITPQAGFVQQLMVTLQTTEQARVAAIPDKITTRSGLVLKLIIPGKLEMGAGRREPGRRANEIQKVVTLTRAYYLGVDEVTNAQYKQFDSGHDSGIFGRAVLGDDDRPVVNVSWDQAAQFCNWLSSRQGLPAAYVKQGSKWVAVTPMNNGFRLPTEAEWAWAARYAAGPHPTRFPWGDAMPPTGVDGNYADESARDMVPYIIEGYNDNYRGTSPVGSFPPNAFGIYDLAGNVSEWNNDYYSVAAPDGTLVDPLGPKSGEYHVIRGSNYTNGRFSELRWTFRDYGEKARPDVGFRVARYVK